MMTGVTHKEKLCVGQRGEPHAPSEVHVVLVFIRGTLTAAGSATASEVSLAELFEQVGAAAAGVAGS
jgi:hypothetical protein